LAYLILRRYKIKVFRWYYLVRKLSRIILNIWVTNKRLSTSWLAFTSLINYLLFWYTLLWITDRILKLLRIIFKKCQAGVWTWPISILNIINYIIFDNLCVSSRVLKMQTWLHSSLSTWHRNYLIIYFLCALRWKQLNFWVIIINFWFAFAWLSSGIHNFILIRIVKLLSKRIVSFLWVLLINSIWSWYDCVFLIQ
jgi:hypothetical protein